ncbi:SRPBCC family protein [Nocardia sp. NPDC052254]|uniref:SRPBCC family protein n=1 Tax=Nocardia sp. NPDC052254 TaxID=3155681 RepID=UPI00342F8DE1
MSNEEGTAELITVGDVPTLRFTRHFPHPPHLVWQAITDPAQLAAWFPAAVEVELRSGAPMRFTFGGQPGAEAPWEGEVLEVDPPKVFMFRWNRDVLRFELIAEDPGCRLVFTHGLGHGARGRWGAARTAAGWDGCLSVLADALDGTGVDAEAAQQDWLARAEGYADAFGLARGHAEPAPGGGMRLRFTRDLVPQNAEGAWAVLVQDSAPDVGAEAPVRADNPSVAPGPVTAADPARALEYESTIGGAPAGRVRWEFLADPDTGTRLEFTHTLPRGFDEQRARLLAVWQVHLELFYAACRDVIRCPWPQQRVTELAATYADA